MQSYLKLYGSGIIKALPVLTEIANEFEQLSSSTSFRKSAKSKALSKFMESFVMRGYYDFVFAWHEPPTRKLLLQLIKMLDEKLLPTKVRYQISTMRKYVEGPSVIMSSNKVTYVKFIGPGIYGALTAFGKKKFTNLNIIHHDMTEGLSDYYFEWKTEPNKQQILELTRQIDALLPKGEYDILYKILTKEATYYQELESETQNITYYNPPYL
jgi:hypothetical protein